MIITLVVMTIVKCSKHILKYIPQNRLAFARHSPTALSSTRAQTARATRQ